MANEPEEIVFFDSCVFFDATNESSDQYRLLKPLMERAEQGVVRILLSTILIPEALFIDRDRSDPEEERKRVNAHLKSPFYRFVSVENFVGTKAQEIRVHHRLSTIDAVHVASAIYSGASVLLTNDGDPKKQCEQKPKSRSILLMHEKYHLFDDDKQPLLKVLTPCQYLIMKNKAALRKREEEIQDRAAAEAQASREKKAKMRQDFLERNKGGIFEHLTEEEAEGMMGENSPGSITGESDVEKT